MKLLSFFGFGVCDYYHFDRNPRATHRYGDMRLCDDCFWESRMADLAEAFMRDAVRRPA